MSESTTTPETTPEPVDAALAERISNMRLGLYFYLQALDRIDAANNDGSLDPDAADAIRSHLPTEMLSRRFTVFAPDAATAAKVRAAFGGSFTKHYGDHYVDLRQALSPTVGLEIAVPRERACTARVVGQRTVVREEPVAYKKVTVTEDVVEWDCDPILADAEEEGSDA